MTGQIPASRRDGGRWWIDLDALRDIRRAMENEPTTAFDEAMLGMIEPQETETPW